MLKEKLAGFFSEIKDSDFKQFWPEMPEGSSPESFEIKFDRKSNSVSVISPDKD